MRINSKTVHFFLPIFYLIFVRNGVCPRALQVPKKLVELVYFKLHCGGVDNMHNEYT